MARKKAPSKKAESVSVVVEDRGRPSKYKPEYCDLIIDVMKQGKSVASFCASVGISRQTFSNWQLHHPEFLEASQTAMEFSQQWWENLATLCATGQIRNYQDKDGNTPYKNANASMIMFMMSRRFSDYHRKIMQGIEVNSGPQLPSGQNDSGLTIDVQKLTTDQLEALESAIIALEA